MTIFHTGRPYYRAVSSRRVSQQNMKFLFFGVAGLVVLLLLALFLLRVTRIEAGHVGVEINLAGSQRGASEIPIRTGWVVYSPLRTQIIEFPTYVQTVKWTGHHQRHPSTKKWASTPKKAWKSLSDVSLSYAIDGAKVPEFYVKYRISDLDLFTHGICATSCAIR